VQNPHDPRLPYYPCAEVGLDWFDRAPVRFPFAVDLDVSPAALFRVFEDPASWPRWAHGIGKVDWTSPRPYTAGTTRTVTFWGGMQVYETFLAFEAPRFMAFRFDGATQEVWSAFGERYEVEDLGSGRSRLRWTVAYEPIGGFARVHPLLRPVMRLNLRSYLWRLGRYVRRLAVTP
jgi:hypothetical protein